MEPDALSHVLDMLMDQIREKAPPEHHAALAVGAQEFLLAIQRRNFFGLKEWLRTTYGDVIMAFWSQADADNTVLPAEIVAQLRAITGDFFSLTEAQCSEEEEIHVFQEVLTRFGRVLIDLLGGYKAAGRGVGELLKEFLAVPHIAGYLGSQSNGGPPTVTDAWNLLPESLKNVIRPEGTRYFGEDDWEDFLSGMFEEEGSA